MSRSQAKSSPQPAQPRSPTQPSRNQHPSPTCPSLHKYCTLSHHLNLSTQNIYKLNPVSESTHQLTLKPYSPIYSHQLLLLNCHFTNVIAPNSTGHSTYSTNSPWVCRAVWFPSSSCSHPPSFHLFLLCHPPWASTTHQHLLLCSTVNILILHQSTFST